MPGTGDPVQRMMRLRAAELRAESAARRGATTRATFLAGSAALGAAAVLARPGAAFGRSRRERRADARQAARTGARVAIVGAGLAGLTCAYRLRQAGVRATVYEARRERLGGRCWTVRGFRHGQVAEHGGEFVDTRHVHLRRIVRELGLELEDRDSAATPEDATRPLWLNGRLRDRDFLFRHGFDDVFARLEAAFERIGDYHFDQASPAARAFDEMSVRDWLRENVPDPLLRETIALGQTGFWGLDPARLSAINLLEAFVFPYEGADERYHVRGGNDRVVHGMAAALDDDQVHVDRALRALRRRTDGTYALELSDTARPVAADLVVLALPFTLLRHIDLGRAGLSAKRRRAIHELGMGTNAKNHFQLEVRPFRLGNWSGSMAMDEPFRQSSWESTAGQPGPTSVITIYRGGRSGASYPTDVPHQPTPEGIMRANLEAFERGVPGIVDAYNGRSWLDSWVDDPWVRGSYAGFHPGQYTKYWGYLRTPEEGIHFAGEHTSTHSQGYLNGGVESGGRAAREVLRALA